MRSAVWFSLLACAAATPAVKITERQEIPCSPIHIIVARGTGEWPGEGKMGAIAQKVQDQLPNSGVDHVGLDYPAEAWGNYAQSEGKGTAAFTKAVQDYVTRCPSSKIVLMGYSQGGQAAMDTICGTSENTFATTAPLDYSKWGKRIWAVLVFGDPSHRANAAWNVGTSVKDGQFPRLNSTACQQYSGKLRSYCDTGDNWCDSGSANYDVHASYFSKYGDAAASWVVSKVNK